MPEPAVPVHPGRRQPLGIPSGLPQPSSHYQVDVDSIMAQAVHQQHPANLTAHESSSPAFENMDDFHLSYSLMDAPMSTNPANSTFFLDMYPQQSHDDNCLDNCQTIAVFNGSRLPHRGGPSSVLSRQFPFASQQFPAFDGQQAAEPPQFHQHQRTASDSFQNLMASPGTHLEAGKGFFEAGPEQDEDNSAHSSCCDSDCNMPDKCTDVACENTTNACNDQNCPARSGSLQPEFDDVANGAAALISINHAQEFQAMQSNESLRSYPSAFDSSRRQSLTGLSMTDALMMSSGSQHHDHYHPDLSSFGDLVNMRDITAHVFSEHSNHETSGCSGSSCLVDSMPDISVCHLPSLDNYRFFNQYSSNSFFPGGYTECGTSISTPEAFVHHFNEYHRQQLVDPSHTSGPSVSSAQIMMTPGLLSSPSIHAHSLPQSPLEHFSPMTTMSNTFSRMGFDPLSAAQPGVKTRSTTSPESPTTPPKTPPSDNPETPGTEVTMGPDWEHKCQWRDSNGTICNKVYENTTDLFDHVNTVHVKSMTKGDDGYSCQWDGCTRVAEGKGGFPQRSKIERHMQTHVGYKPHTCGQCGAGFSAKQALDQHLLIHTDEKPLQCPTCGKKIRHQSALTMHMRTHTGEKPLRCNICGKRFSESSNLSKHKRTHDDKGRFSCGHPGCDANFHRQDQLRRHRNNCHKDDTAGLCSDPGSPTESQMDHPAANNSTDGPNLNRPLHGTSGPTPSFDPQPIRKIRAGGVRKHGRSA